MEDLGKVLPKALKSCPNSIKLPNLVTLLTILVCSPYSKRYGYDSSQKDQPSFVTAKRFADLLPNLCWGFPVSEASNWRPRKPPIDDLESLHYVIIKNRSVNAKPKMRKDDDGNSILILLPLFVIRLVRRGQAPRSLGGDKAVRENSLCHADVTELLRDLFL